MKTHDNKTIQQIRDLYKQGLSERKIAKQLNICRSSVVKYKTNQAQIDIFKEKQKKYWDSNRKHLYQKQRQWRQRHPKKLMLNVIISRAKKKGLDCNLTIEDLLDNQICPVFKTKLMYNRDEKDHKLKASVDRIDNTKGYTKDNIAIISRRANTLKSNGSLKEFKRLVDYIETSLKEPRVDEVIDS